VSTARHGLAAVFIDDDNNNNNIIYIIGEVLSQD
jgi:hypothetical protein